MEMSVWDWIALVLVVVGGLNWGLVGLLNLDVVRAVFGTIPVLEQIVYIIIGLGAVYMIYAAAMKKKK